MFETAVVRARAADRRLLSLSVVAHTAIVAAVIAASVASTRLPTEAPRQMLPFVFVDPPPPLGNPAPPRAATPHVSGPARLPVLHTTTAPQVIPETIPNVAPAAAATSLGNNILASSGGRE